MEAWMIKKLDEERRNRESWSKRPVLRIHVPDWRRPVAKKEDAKRGVLTF